MAKIPDYLKMSTQKVDDLMTRESRIRISTIGPGAQINLTPMTFGWAQGFVYIFGRGQKVVNLRRNPTATVLVDIGDSWRELQGVMMNGTAKILESSIDESADEHLLEAQLNLGRKSGLVIPPLTATVRRPGMSQNNARPTRRALTNRAACQR